MAAADAPAAAAKGADPATAGPPPRFDHGIVYLKVLCVVIDEENDHAGIMRLMCDPGILDEKKNTLISSFGVVVGAANKVLVTIPVKDPDQPRTVFVFLNERAVEIKGAEPHELTGRGRLVTTFAYTPSLVMAAAPAALAPAAPAIPAVGLHKDGVVENGARRWWIRCPATCSALGGDALLMDVSWCLPLNDVKAADIKSAKEQALKCHFDICDAKTGDLLLFGDAVRPLLPREGRGARYFKSTGMLTFTIAEPLPWIPTATFKSTLKGDSKQRFEDVAAWEAAMARLEEIRLAAAAGDRKARG